MAPSIRFVASLSAVSLFLQPVLGGTVRRDLNPNMPVAEGTTTSCDFWYDNDGSVDCDFLPDLYGCSLQDFFRWNPSLKGSCASFPTDFSYCVEGPSAPTSTSTKPPVSSTTSKATLSSTTKASSTTSKASSTSSAPSNGIETPLPTQPDIVDNCDDFYLVKSGDKCTDIVKKYGITLAQFTTWNAGAGSDCTGLWGNAYACVSIIGHTPTPTNPGNGIETPEPPQPGMVDNCDEFYFVKPGDKCADIVKSHGITLAQFTTWNSGVGSDCSGLWGSAYACVSIIGHTPTPTNPGNGIETPQPIQDGMTTNCNKFHLTKSGNTCTTIQNTYKISFADLYKWNPAIGSSCGSLWLDTYVCVGVIGGTPTNPPGNGIETPQPIQDGMVNNCKKFHFVKTGQTCQTVQDLYKVTLANLVKWNPAIGSGCNNLWANTNMCVGV